MNIDYKKPVSIYYQSDNRTSQERAHRFLLSAERNFVPSSSHVLCKELRYSWCDYRPKSESAKEFQWKINQFRNAREELAPSHSKIAYNHQFSDKIKATKCVNYFHVGERRGEKTFTELPRDVKSRNSFNAPAIQHNYRETQFTSTPGYYPLLDGLVSTTDLDFHKHREYVNTQTKLIPRIDLPFNANVAFFIPKINEIIKKSPMTKESQAENIRDTSKFTAPSYDRITITKVPYRGLESEFKGNF